MKTKITLKDIARELEVSISTVSKALKNSEEISRDTKEKVQAFAKLYNYKPNNIAISLKNKRTKNIGVVIPDIVHHFFTTVIRGIEKYANARGYNVIVCLSEESFDKEVINMEMLANGSIDGFIMSLSSETQQKGDYNHLKEVTEQGIPVVLFDRITNEIDCDKVVIDDELGGYMATKKFIEQGKKRIALISTDDYLSVSKARSMGYRKALSESKLGVDESLVLKMPSMEMDENRIKEFLEAQKPDAVLCVNEIFAVYSMRLVQKNGLKIPDDISFIGFTDGVLSKYANPSLTVVAQHGEKMGEVSAKMLIDKIESEEEEETYQTKILEPTLVIRESINH
ncbi:LacI family transcriptional regulator [Flagellimonas taeanensis]|uniref:Transcriptional regulator, LacI family n=1 Tax=Flagellimonas taeanensis TaxID=1005926 RepID=A0A1M6PFF1_9FLAO|nr:LacI family DNA-binding transcriptional regulator [Allomuricauda taeanensis]RIV48963.1 LacI family transcriptional regulator [Allomuricauda taeanensis]SFB66746.1 transcriptional regulator, LacI family [Allomuricauda taeanensis]SHK06688.1 transcriptional regulator, LacI family [Allomuricauda taeanensis]